MERVNKQSSELVTHHIAYISAAKVAEVLEGSTGVSDEHVLLAPKSLAMQWVTEMDTHFQ
ncbi:MAG: hypothetical protein GY808_01165 [Gammaproteobacteria bacterium]|nr:hypothetical protein [Gammaproteobacteria bacterium]